ncbi:MAG TPA: hypothetical protein VJT71_07490, partial [Pyrinomonadaceae bacterium]|nr:hypothetical protein [Pyrinomonadaceae bacterium]
DPQRSQEMFLALWKFTKDQTDENFDKQQAKLLILKHLFSRNPKLARQLLAAESKAKDSAPASRLPGQNDDSGVAARVAAELVDTDASTAAGLLEGSLSKGPTPAGMGALLRLRERNSSLSDYVATRVLDALIGQPTIVSLPGLHTMGAYVFPGSEAPIPSMEAESSLQLLQYRYFLAGSEVLRASLTETSEALSRDQHLGARELQFRAFYQAQIARIVAALAQRFQPSSAVELAGIATRLAPQVPANMPQVSPLTLARLSGTQLTSDDPETNFAAALSNGDFEEASKQLDRLKDGEKKEMYAQLLIKVQARALLAKADVMGALTAIRKIQDQTTRLAIYLDALKATKKKDDAALTNIVINEARLLVPQTDRNGFHLRALFAFATQLTNPETKDEAMEFLNSAVTTINALGKKSGEKGAANNLREMVMDDLNDPNSLFDSPEMEQAFSSAGLADLDATLTQAKRIDMKSIQLLARIESLQGVIKRLSLKPRAMPKAPNSSSPPKRTGSSH